MTLAHTTLQNQCIGKIFTERWLANLKASSHIVFTMNVKRASHVSPITSGAEVVQSEKDSGDLGTCRQPQGMT